MSNVMRHRYGNTVPIMVPIASATVVEIGDLISLESGKATVMNAVTDNITFIGVAMQASKSDEANDIRVAQAGIFEYPLDTATTVAVGEGVQYSAAQKVKKSETDAIGTVQKAVANATGVLIQVRTLYGLRAGETS